MQTPSLSFVLASALLATACGQSTMPTSPSALSGATGAAGVVTATTSSTTITALKEGGSRNVSSSSGGSTTSGSDERRGGSSGPSLSSGSSNHGSPSTEDHDRGQSEVQAEGLVTLATGTCPLVSITVGTQVFATTALTDFQRGDCLLVVPGARVHISGRLVDGVLTASIVRLQGRIHDGPDDDGVSADPASPDDDSTDVDAVPPPAPTPTPTPTPSPTPTV